MALTVAVIDDNADHLLLVKRFLRDVRQDISIQAFENADIFFATLKCDPTLFDLVLLDYQMPGLNGLQTLRKLRALSPHVPIIMMTAYGSIDQAVTALKDGASDYLTKPFSNPKDFQLRIEKALSQGLLLKQNQALRAELGLALPTQLIFGSSAPMQEIQKVVERAAPTTAAVLILGENGTGKDLLARYIHENSPRCNAAFITVDCASIPENLLETELFGHVKGAFTGALADKKGLLEMAQGGTVFFDEIAELPLRLQSKLLRFIQSHEVRPTGSLAMKRIDVRIIAATNRALEIEVKRHRFRQDLFFRLNIFQLKLPTLAQRLDDIPNLAQHFINTQNLIQGRHIEGINAQGLKALRQGSWPGNIRQLKNIIERVCSFAEDHQEISEALLVRHMPVTASAREARRPPFHQAKHQALGRFTKTYLEDLLKVNQGNITAAAKAANMGRQNLHRLIKDHGLKPRHFRRP